MFSQQQIQAIANHLQVSESDVLRVENWFSVLFVVVKGKGGRFVSERVIAGLAEPQTIKPVVWVMRGESRRWQLSKKWVARVTGRDPKYVLARQFLTGRVTEWGRHGVVEVQFDLDSPGYYHTSMGSYLHVVEEGGEFVAHEVCYAQVLNAFGGGSYAPPAEVNR